MSSNTAGTGTTNTSTPLTPAAGWLRASDWGPNRLEAGMSTNTCPCTAAVTYLSCPLHGAAETLRFARRIRLARRRRPQSRRVTAAWGGDAS